MFRQIKSRLLGRASSNVAREFAEDPNSPWLVSFPRTGSHWLRMMLERYSARPLLPRSFFDHDSTDYLLNHTHDLDFSCTVRRVIYLYRDPVPTIYSQLRFHRQDAFDEHYVRLWSTVYQLHLTHWLARPHENRTVIRYEDMKADIESALGRVLHALDLPVKTGLIAQVAGEIDKDRVKSQTRHDPRVVSRDAKYDLRRAEFAERMGPLVRRVVIEEGNLHRYFDRPETPLREAA